MGLQPKHEGQQFTVREEKVLNYVMAVLYFAVAGVGIGMMIYNKALGGEAALLAFMLPSFLHLKKATSPQVYIRINKTGIYHMENLVTDWQHLLNAFISEGVRKRIYDTTDKFQLVVEFTKEDPTKGFRKKIPLHNTQNQSEEDILTAVKYFWHLYANEKGLFGAGTEELKTIS